jgi:hypothetical protein
MWHFAESRQDGNIAVWLMNGLQLVQSDVIAFVPLNWSVAETGDFNGDGFSDILWRDNNAGATTIWFMQGTQVSQGVGLGVVPTSWTIQGLDAE